MGSLECTWRKTGWEPIRLLMSTELGTDFYFDFKCFKLTEKRSPRGQNDHLE